MPVYLVHDPILGKSALSASREAAVERMLEISEEIKQSNCPESWNEVIVIEFALAGDDVINFDDAPTVDEPKDYINSSSDS